MSSNYTCMNSLFSLKVRSWHPQCSAACSHPIHFRQTSFNYRRNYLVNNMQRLKKVHTVSFIYLKRYLITLQTQYLSKEHTAIMYSVQLFATLWTVAHKASLSMGFSRQEYWCGLPFPSPGNLPDPGIKFMSPVSPALTGGFFTHWAIREAH